MQISNKHFPPLVGAKCKVIFLMDALANDAIHKYKTVYKYNYIYVYI